MTASPEPIRVLHVEDDPEFAEVAGQFLEREGEEFTIESAPTAEAGLDRLAVASYDVVVSDFDLPGADGIEFLRAVREDLPALPFVLFTGKGSEEVASEAISAGVTDYLQKEAGTDQYALLANRIRNAVERHRATEAVRETEEWVTTLLEHSSDYLFVVDGTGQISYVSPSIERVMGYDPAAVTGSSAFEFTHPDDVEQATEAFLETLEDPEREVTVQFRALDADGDVRWLEVRGRNLLDDPVVNGVLVNVRDITDRQALSARLERERDRFRAVFEQAFDAMVIADDEGTYLEANESAAELFGVRESALLGSSITDFAPDDFDIDDAWRQFRSSASERGTFPLVRPDGTERVVEYAATADVTPGRHLSVMRDVTERERRDEELRRVRERMEFALETTDSVIFELDYESGTETRHGPFDRLYGIPGAEVRTLGEFYDRAVHPDDRATVESRQSDVIERRTDAIQVEYRTHPDAGDVQWVRSSMAQVPGGPDDDSDSLIGLSTIITPLKEREAELERQNERLEQFAAFLSHDLRNPLNVAEGRLELAREAHDSDDLAAVARAHDRMRRLIEDLLTIARESGPVTARGVADLADAADQCWPDLGTESATLTVETDRSVRANPRQLQQLLENLLRNAIEHGGEGVSVTVGDLDDGFFVEDDGPGLDHWERARVFDDGYSTSDDGTGLGLSIVRAVVEAHGWTIDVHSSQDGGARFEIRGVEPA